MSLSIVPKQLHNTSLPHYSRLAIAAASSYMTLSGPALALNFRNPGLAAADEAGISSTLQRDTGASMLIGKIPLWHPLPMSLYHELTISNFYKFCETPMLNEDSYAAAGQQLLRKLGTLNTTYFTAMQPPGWKDIRTPALSSIEPVQSPHRKSLSVKLSLWDKELRPLSMMLLTGPNDDPNAPVQQIVMSEELEKAEQLLKAPMSERMKQLEARFQSVTLANTDGDGRSAAAEYRAATQASSPDSFLVGNPYVTASAGSSSGDAFFLRQCAIFPRVAFSECSVRHSADTEHRDTMGESSARVVPPWAVHCAVTEFASNLVSAMCGSTAGGADLLAAVSRFKIQHGRTSRGQSVDTETAKDRAVSSISAVCRQLAEGGEETQGYNPQKKMLRLVAHNVVWHEDLLAGSATPAVPMSHSSSNEKDSSSGLVEIAAQCPKFFSNYCTKPWEHSVGHPLVRGEPMVAFRCQVCQDGRVIARGSFFFCS